MKNTESDIFSYLITNEDFRDWVLSPNEESNTFWKKWMEKHPESISEVKKAREFIERMTFSKEQLAPDELDGLLDKIMADEEPVRFTEGRVPENKTMFYGLSQWMKVAAILVICFLSAVVVNEFFPNEPLESLPVAVEWKTVDNPKGLKSNLILPDGTRVMLNSASSIQYPEIFSDSQRVVILKGEAFFEVVRNEKKPFIINTERMITEVLGTSFNIKAYADGEDQFTAVVSGKVKVSNTLGEVQILNPNEMGLIGKDNNINKTTFDVKYVTGWKDGIISFKRATFSEIKEELSMWYGVEFELAPGFEMSNVYTGEFTNETLENVMHGIAYSSEFEYEIKDGKVYVYN
uniref:FecR domain-containing protein n=1 Tax=Roseihalotalea indica TaxID=2867963 RepID=A0AA49GIV5_9BACT|nr:FecR domain-containing protein [Tunicatimonas sp. TK19036]